MVQRREKKRVNLFYGTLLHIACWAKNLELAKECLEEGFEINVRDIYGRTPFFYSLPAGLEMIKLFVENACDTNTNDINGNNLIPIFHYAPRDSDYIDNYLHKKNIKITNEYILNSKKTPIIFYPYSNMCNESVNDMDIHGFTPLIRTLIHHESEEQLLKKILELKVDVNLKSVHGHTPLMFALLWNVKTEFLIKLLEKGAIVNCFDNIGNSVLSYAMCSFLQQNVDVLMENGAKVDEFQGEGKPPLIWAVIFKNSKAVNYLLSKNANVNQLDGNGNTALAYAAFYGNLDIAKILLENGAKVDLYDEGKKMAKSPLVWAIIGDQIEMVNLLLENEGNVNMRDAFGNTLLMTAARYQRIDILMKLIKEDIAIDAVSNDGKTALYNAVKTKNKEIVKLLFKNGADDVTIESVLPLCIDVSYGNVVLDAAIETDQPDIIELFIKKFQHYQETEMLLSEQNNGNNDSKLDKLELETKCIKCGVFACDGSECLEQEIWKWFNCLKQMIIILIFLIVFIYYFDDIWFF